MSSETLTEDYFPHVVGASATEITDLRTAPEGVIRMVSKTINEAGGLTRSLLLYNSVVVGSDEQIIKRYGEGKETDPPHCWRVRDGYVETAINQDPNQVWWPEIKIGAKAGDSWSSSNSVGGVKATLVSFFVLDGRPCALVREHLTIGGMPITKSIWYMKGVGLIRCESYSSDAAGSMTTRSILCR